MSLSDRFGFLSEELEFDIDGYKVYPVEDFKKLLKDVKKIVNQDGFIYPPMIYSGREVKLGVFKKIKRIPNSERPAHLYKLPASHIIETTTDLSQRELRLGISGFIIQLIGYIFGIRLQFHDWWFDSRIAFDKQHNISISKVSLTEFISNSLDKFRNWQEEDRKFFINILYMHNRSPSYEWDWERFTIEYMVFDACWKFSGLRARRHGERIQKICERFNLYYKEEAVNRITNLRNNLFHEALWSNGQPCTAGDSNDFYASYNLRRLNHRLIAALLGYNSNYIKSNWTSIGCYKF